MLNITNLSYLNSLLLANIRTTYIKDAFSLYLLEPMGVIGTLLNLITFIILSKKKFNNKNIFKLMKIYNLISLGITLISSFNFLSSPHILFQLTISKIGRIYSCIVIPWLYIFFFFFGNCLDILMNLDRALNFSAGYQRIKQISSYWICFIVLIICLIIHMPSNLVYEVTPDDQLYTRLRLCYLTSFAVQPVTKIILLVVYIIEGPVVMILVIGSNILAYASYKAFMKRKLMTTSVAFNVNTQQLAITTHAVELTKIEKRRKAKREKINKRLLKMTIYLTIFSIVSHLIQFAAQLIIFVFSPYVSVTVFLWAQFSFIFIVVFKHFFTIFFYFNINFKAALNCWSKKRPIPTNINNNNN